MEITENQWWESAAWAEPLTNGKYRQPKIRGQDTYSRLRDFMLPLQVLLSAPSFRDFRRNTKLVHASSGNTQTHNHIKQQTRI